MSGREEGALASGTSPLQTTPSDAPAEESTPLPTPLPTPSNAAAPDPADPARPTQPDSQEGATPWEGATSQEVASSQEGATREPGRRRRRRSARHEQRRQTLTLAAGVAVVMAVTAATTSGLVALAEGSPTTALRASALPLASQSSPPPATSSPGASLVSPSTEPSTEPSPTTPSVPPSTANYVDAWIPMPQTRLDEMAQYAQARYGKATSALAPSMIVLHFTEGSAQGTISFFAQDLPQSGVYPGVCAHFVIDQAGAVYRLVPTTTMCRHVVGLNDKAIGIEIEQSTMGNSSAWADRQILDRPAQIDAVLATLKDLQHTYHIPTDRIIGHGMANDDPQFRDLTGARNDHTDMGYDAVMEIRRRLDAMP